MINKYITKLSNEQIYDQVLQILNYSGNFLGTDKFNMALLLANCFYVLKPYVNKEFRHSLINSLSCLDNPSSYMEQLTHLKDSDKNSFVLAPLSASDHIFSVIIYKKNTSFECIVVNKGYRPNLHIYQKYLIEKENLKNVIGYLGYTRDPHSSVSDIYKAFLKNSHYNNSLYNLTSRSQKEGNCFFKELEAALKFAYSNAYFKAPELKTRRFHTKNIKNVKASTLLSKKARKIAQKHITIDSKTPKWPISTMSVHRKLISNIKNACPSLTYAIDEIESVYVKNKQFRSLCKILPDLDFEEKEQIFRHIFANNENNTLPEMLKYLDLQTISQNVPFLMSLCSTYNMSTLEITSIELLNPPIPNIMEHIDLLKSIKKVFPNAYKQLQLNYSSSLNLAGSSLINKNDLYGALEAYNNSILLNPNNSNSYVQRAVIFRYLNKTNNAEADFNYSIKLAPNDVNTRLLYARFLYDNKRLQEALSQCNIIKDIEPNYKDNVLLKMQIHTDLALNNFNSVG